MLNWQERTVLLTGNDGIEKLRNAHVLVAGLGGVGAYAAEMLCRAGVGSLTLIDNDRVSQSNINRQLIALSDNVGELKTDLVRNRFERINPQVKITTITQYITENNIETLLQGDYNYVVDAIDTLSPKVSLIKTCIAKGLPLVSSMGAGAKLDPCRVKVDDISKSKYCPLAHMLRKRLGKLGIKRGFKVIYSDEIPIETAMIPCDEPNKKTITGTISYMPAVFGCCCASVVIRDLLEQ